MADDLTMRTCGRAGCRWPAAASLSFRYATGQVWLLDLTPEPDPALYDLCPHHAGTLTVPRGWERVDQRTAHAVVTEPAGRDLDPDDGGAPPGAGGYGSNRYASLHAALPRLAREQAGETRPEGEAVDLGAGAAAEGALAGAPGGAVDLGAGAAAEGAPAGAPGGAVDVAAGSGEDEAVVVPIEAGSRRRG